MFGGLLLSTHLIEQLFEVGILFVEFGMTGTESDREGGDSQYQRSLVTSFHCAASNANSISDRSPSGLFVYICGCKNVVV